MYRSGPRTEPCGTPKGAWTQAGLEEPNVTRTVCALREKGAKPRKWFISQTKRCRRTLEENTVIYQIKSRADVKENSETCPAAMALWRSDRRRANKRVSVE